MAQSLVTDSGVAESIVLEKELEASATRSAIITLTLVFEASAAAAVKILVNQKIVAEVLPDVVATVSKQTVTFAVAAGHVYEVKKAVKLKEALASVALAQVGATAANIAELIAEAKKEAETTGIAAQETLREKNAKILSLTSN